MDMGSIDEDKKIVDPSIINSRFVSHPNDALVYPAERGN